MAIQPETEADRELKERGGTQEFDYLVHKGEIAKAVDQQLVSVELGGCGGHGDSTTG